VLWATHSRYDLRNDSSAIAVQLQTEKQNCTIRATGRRLHLKRDCARIKSYLCHELVSRAHPGARALRTAHNDSTKRSPRQGRS